MNDFILLLYKNSSEENTYARYIHLPWGMNWSPAKGPTVGYTDGEGHGFQVE